MSHGQVLLFYVMEHFPQLELPNLGLSDVAPTSDSVHVSLTNITLLLIAKENEAAEVEQMQQTTIKKENIVYTTKFHQN